MLYDHLPPQPGHFLPGDPGCAVLCLLGDTHRERERERVKMMSKYLSAEEIPAGGQTDCARGDGVSPSSNVWGLLRNLELRAGQPDDQQASVDSVLLLLLFSDLLAPRSSPAVYQLTLLQF